MNPVKALENHGQAVWLDFLARGFVANGDLKKLIDTDGVKGVTSNPSIFEKAIGSSDEYDGAIGKALKKGDRPIAELFEHLAVEDIQHAADVLRPVYDELKGEDGFVSCIDSAVDKAIDEKIARANDPTEKKRLAALKGKIAIANAKLAYRDYKRLFSGSRWDKLAAKGAKPQRLLWASTGTKNKDYSDVLYVEELIGPNTVNTVPPATLDAFRDHGTPRGTLEENIEDARGVLAELDTSGISLDAITEDLVRDGVKLFADAADKLYGAVAHNRAAVLGAGIDRQALALGSHIGKAVDKTTENWRATAKIPRRWQHDNALCTATHDDTWLPDRSRACFAT